MTDSPAPDPAPAPEQPAQPAQISLKDLPREIVLATLAGAQGGLAVVNGQLSAIHERLGTMNVKLQMDPRRAGEIRVRQAELTSFMQGLINLRHQLEQRVAAIAHARPEFFQEVPPPAPEEKPVPKIEIPGGA